ncbi:hypothetical protein [Actinophytocola oryzae]|uniref:Uncharacterized protein n=1 Tax=Actinophytocola oryzae TaxID=502181 RepID=A0A4R7V0W4_9PSEU|nr:hypothetical protein [Actinophytocola oryzae]TDV41046.1 hypothetical protein CLV71_121112 [Actinophytocola oryzae]
MANALYVRELFRVLVTRSVRHSVTRQLRVRPLPAPQPAWQLPPPDARQEWSDWLRVDLPDRLVPMLVTAWLDQYVWSVLNPPAPPPAVTTEPPGGDEEKPGRPQLTVGELVEMMESSYAWLVHGTLSRNVGRLLVDHIDASEPAGRDDPNAAAGVYAYPGVQGVNYGGHCVFFREGAVETFRAYTESANPEEHLSTNDVPLDLAHGWALRTRVEEARQVFLARTKGEQAN